ncbi:MAG: HD domain-containing protein [Verrucomicrobiota bacterium]
MKNLEPSRDCAGGGESAPTWDHEWLWQSAAVFAAKAHSGLTTPGTDDPYFSHSARVALLISAVFRCHDEELLAAAHLHDVLEKTEVRSLDLSARFGDRVAEWVEWLSKDEKGGRDTYWDRLPAAPWQARLIKMADALDHLNGLTEYRPARLRAARKALKLANSHEPEIERAAKILRQAIAAQEASPNH